MPYPPLKHVIDSDALGEAGGAVKTIDLAIGTENPDPYTNANNVRNGSIVRQIVAQIDWVNSNSSQVSMFDWYCWFNIAGAQGVVTPLGGVNSSNTKNQVFHQDGALQVNMQATGVGIAAANVAKWRLVINIPRGFQTINRNDKIQFVYYCSDTSANNNTKWRFIYKEIFP